MSNEIIKYFKSGLKKKLRRPNCGRFLSLWDDRIWTNHIPDTTLDYIKSNDFLLFLYQTKYDLCCIQDNNGQNLSNAIDKFFYLLTEFETYFNIFISNNIYANREEVSLAIKSERDDIYIKKDVMKKHFIDEKTKENLKNRNIFVSAMEKKAYKH